jgi:hypothetical protein
VDDGTVKECENWIIKEVKAGKLTVELGDYVCWNMQTGVHYNDVGVGLTAAKSGETVQMLADDVSHAELLWAKKGTTLDLNGFEVEADYVIFVNSSDLVDNSASNTGVMMANEQITLGIDNDQVPVYDADLGGYVFAVYQIQSEQSKLVIDKENDKATLKFNAYIETKNGFYTYYFGDGVLDNNINISATGVWANANGVINKEFVASEQTVMDVVNSGYRLAYEFTLENYSQYLGYGDIKITPKIVSTITGAEAAGNTVTISAE